MLINLRNALMAGKRLPYDAELEYLGCAGTNSAFPYIDTGIVGASDVTFTASVYRSTNVSNECAIGSYGSSLRYWASYFFSNTYYLGMGSRTDNPTPAPTETWMLQELKIENGNFNLYSNGSLVASRPTSTFSTNQNIYIGCMNYDGVAAFYFSGRIGFVRIYSNGALVRDYIPVRKGTVGYLYDRVSGKLFGNAGTGDFVLGPDVVPVEYIESRSNHIQVIDTGFYANQNTKSLITFEKLGADGWLFGSRNGSSSATDKFGIFAYQYPDGKISAQVGNTYIEPIISGGLTYRKKTIELSLADGVTVDGETIATFSESQKSQTFTSTYPMALFNMRISSSGHNAGIYCRVYAYQIFENGLIARNFLPVRVGTDATSWEGAMMDVLTRRIYRNAGTGAFTYGNDLKYPIPA